METVGPAVAAVVSWMAAYDREKAKEKTGTVIINIRTNITTITMDIRHITLTIKVNKMQSKFDLIANRLDF